MPCANFLNLLLITLVDKTLKYICVSTLHIASPSPNTHQLVGRKGIIATTQRSSHCPNGYIYVSIGCFTELSSTTIDI